MEWVRYPQKCPFMYDDCGHCGPFEVCIEAFVLVRWPDEEQITVSTQNIANGHRKVGHF
jgi:hypothetical protein